MLLRTLSQLNFRNLETPRLEFAPGVTAVVGDNAAGKSNLLDAAYLGCTGELPGGKIVESVRLGESEGFVGVTVEHDEGSSHVEIGLAPGRKVLRLDGQSARTLDIARVCSAVLVTPEDVELVHGSPSARRAYLDSLLGRLSARYAVLLREYNRVVEQRNAALKSPVQDTSFEVWTHKFVELGRELNDLRQRAVVRVTELASASYRDIAGDGKCLAVALRRPQGELALEEALDRTRELERARGATLVGPHRDDLALELDGTSLQAYGSRGEARTAALGLRVAEYRLLDEKHGEAPILLLDDFTAELDANRRAFLLQLASTTPQVLVSGTEAPPAFAQRYRVGAGVIRPG